MLRYSQRQRQEEEEDSTERTVFDCTRMRRTVPTRPTLRAPYLTSRMAAIHAAILVAVVCLVINAHAFVTLPASQRAISISRPALSSTPFTRISSSPPRQPTLLCDIHKWRDIDFGFPGGNPPVGAEAGPLPKSICILPFDYREVLLQGETKQLRLYEDRFIKLFDDCMQNHGGLVAMGLLASSSGIIQTVPLCDIEAYNRVDGFGIFVTIRVVGRAELIELTQQDPYMKAVCTEISDKLPPNLELPNLVASNIENLMLLLSSMEHRLQQARKDEGEKVDDPEMKRRMEIARLVSVKWLLKI
jgi:Lon protease-like protein